MKGIKIFIVVGLFFLLASAAVTAYVWNLLQNTLEEQESSQTQRVPGEPVMVGDLEVPAEGITISSDSLTESQKAVVETIGLDADSYTITPEMIGCAEAKLGAERVQELVAGASPSVLESVPLISCLK